MLLSGYVLGIFSMWDVSGSVDINLISQDLTLAGSREQKYKLTININS